MIFCNLKKTILRYSGQKLLCLKILLFAIILISRCPDSLLLLVLLCLYFILDLGMLYYIQMLLGTKTEAVIEKFKENTVRRK
jgi:hypothetical protein